jgi:hypothetical protein
MFWFFELEVRSLDRRSMRCDEEGIWGLWDDGEGDLDLMMKLNRINLSDILRFVMSLQSVIDYLIMM